MIPVVAPRFHLDTCNTEIERDFIEALHVRSKTAAWFPDAWVWNDRVVIAVYSSDVTPEYNILLRTLRVDFYGQELRCGPDETHQFVTDLNVSRPESWSCRI